jgi:hypothetical protein
MIEQGLYGGRLLLADLERETFSCGGIISNLDPRREPGRMQHVGWVERSDTHRLPAFDKEDGFRFALPILQTEVDTAGSGFHSSASVVLRTASLTLMRSCRSWGGKDVTA